MIKAHRTYARIRRKKGHFSISAVAHMLTIHQQTIRMYEREGLICPHRSEGNTRLFTEDDISRLEEIMYLTHKAGVNLAGVEIILKQQRQIKKLQQEINRLFKKANSELDEEHTLFAQKTHEAVRKLAEARRYSKALGTTIENSGADEQNL